MTLSIGVAVFGEHGTTAAEMIKAADAALYVAKESGRDGWWTADSVDEGSTHRPAPTLSPLEVEALSEAARAADEDDIDLAEIVSLAGPDAMVVAPGPAPEAEVADEAVADRAPDAVPDPVADAVPGPVADPVVEAVPDPVGVAELPAVAPASTRHRVSPAPVSGTRGHYPSRDAGRRTRTARAGTGARRRAGR
jgi:hypothetical protein